MQIRLAAVFLVVLAGSGVAQDWAPMSGPQILATLTDQGLVYQDAEQRFFASGRTLYNAGEDRWGTWAVRDDQYCSQWPPSDSWSCYDMTQLENSVRFIDPWGNVSEGVLAE